MTIIIKMMTILFLWINVTVTQYMETSTSKSTHASFRVREKKRKKKKRIVLMQVTQSSVQHVSSNLNGATNMNMPYS
jgi:fibronectin type 3 domain-containing protein